MKRGVRQLRIVGGLWRGRRIGFQDEPGLRPTPDRVRETLFNWLAPHIAGMRALDLYAGSGALGFEALSRGASEAVMIDNRASVVQTLRDTAATLNAGGDSDRRAHIERADALSFLDRAAAQSPVAPFDLVFVDPPFDANLVSPTITRLHARGLLAPGGFCYVETPRQQPLPPLPPGWAVHRSGTAGEVGYHLLHGPPRNLPGDV
ncbi:MAG: 16S rRNA (guanine(966)-N(2))-methyltransferase RsmD [Nevskiaceae bacterium]|jgi:16S rRNA (guanine966-N2)-methyltransferase|nr:16S rRNA (guanine(966)-N(2))-methyltransferase RsmD [Nevskiaceae bacterium]